jgi:hypothetical protein
MFVPHADCPAGIRVAVFFLPQLNHNYTTIVPSDDIS